MKKFSLFQEKEIIQLLMTTGITTVNLQVLDESKYKRGPWYLKGGSKIAVWVLDPTEARVNHWVDISKEVSLLSAPTVPEWPPLDPAV